MKTTLVFCVIIFIIKTTETEAKDVQLVFIPTDQKLPEKCTSGSSVLYGCNTCFCTDSSEWACQKRFCPRKTRSVPVGADLKNTPCAPGDYFKIDCNTCYCNIEKTGYLCTLNICPYETSNKNEAAAINATTVPPILKVDTNATSTPNTTLDL